MTASHRFDNAKRRRPESHVRELLGGIGLDPFSGAGTTGVVARRLGRSVTLIDVKEEYCEMARDRIKTDCPHD